MRNFVDKVLVELTSNKDLKDNSLVKMVTESAVSSINSGINAVEVYSKLKSSISDINEHLKNSKLSNIIEQFNKNEESPDSKLLELSKMGDLLGKLKEIKETYSYSNPIIKEKVDSYIKNISDGIAEFTLYPSFIKDFSSHLSENVVVKAVNNISSIINKNKKDLEVLYSINQMKNGVNFPLYESICKYLTECLVNRKYSADSISMKYRATNLPLVSLLIQNLRIVESNETGKFTLGAGDGNTHVNNVITPSIKGKDKTIITYYDNRFISISESSELTGNEEKVHINSDGFIISTLLPNYVKENYSNFYFLCEAYSKLGFKGSKYHSGIETSNIRNFKLGLSLNEEAQLNLYVNDSLVEKIEEVNVPEALVMESEEIKNIVKLIFENLDSISNFDFIKCISNSRTLKEATIYKLGKKYFLCEHTNAADRNWKKVNELEMYEYFIGNYEYDISPVFGTEITKQAKLENRKNKRKNKIQSNIVKLEETISKLDSALSSKKLDTTKISKLEKIKESVFDHVSVLKEKYISIDVKDLVIEKKEEDTTGQDNPLKKKNAKNKDKNPLETAQETVTEQHDEKDTLEGSEDVKKIGKKVAVMSGLTSKGIKAPAKKKKDKKKETA